jgi:hypothetical protein
MQSCKASQSNEYNFLFPFKHKSRLGLSSVKDSQIFYSVLFYTVSKHPSSTTVNHYLLLSIFTFGKIVSI